MSDILIKNTEMPKSCITGKIPYYEYCPFFGGCPKASAKTERPYDCPLVEIKPHGRLIDADRLADEFDVYLATTYPYMQNSVAEGMVNDVRLATQIAPTILEATE